METLRYRAALVVTYTHMRTHKQILYLQWVLGADGQDLVLEVAELTTPGASLADPADEAGLVSTAHRAVTATRAQQLPLQDTDICFS
jgi:hypothetical protein